MHTTLSKKDFSRYLPFLLLVMTVFRVLAGLRIPYMILANQRYDDRLLFENAYDLLSGVWLGSYDSYTLAKGIGYPLFLVLAKKLCLPYSVLLSLLQAAGAWLFVRAVSVRWQNPYGQAILYLLLLFCRQHQCLAKRSRYNKSRLCFLSQFLFTFNKIPTCLLPFIITFNH